MKFSSKIFCCLMLIFISYQVSSYAQCSNSEEDYPKELMEEFVQGSNWSDVRIENGLTSIDIQDIERLSNSNSNYECTKLSDLVKDRFDEYKVYFYKVKSTYLVISIVKQPETIDEVTVGLSFLEIFDNSYSRIEGYSF